MSTELEVVPADDSQFSWIRQRLDRAQHSEGPREGPSYHTGLGLGTSAQGENVEG